MAMTADEHLSGWGKVAGNLLTVEQLLRIFLCEAGNEKVEYPKPGEKEAKLTHLTNRDPLSAVITEFNSQLSKDESSYTVDNSIVDIRDAMAHGRLVSTAEYPVTLYRFGKPVGDRVAVANADVLDVAWFDAKRTLVFAQIDKITGCSAKRGYKYLTPPTG